MRNENQTITRRDFLRGATCATLAATVGLPSLRAEDTESASLTKVVLVRDETAVDDQGLVNGATIKRMLDQALTELFGTEKPIAAWKTILKPDDVLGIKTNVWGPLPTPLEVEDALKAGAFSAGVEEKNIAISDRGVLRSDIFKQATALINVRPLRTHHWSGIGGLIKNYIMFTPSPSAYHDNSCASLAKLWELPQVQGKTRLQVLVVLTPQFHGTGPHHFDNEFIWSYKGLLVGTDPVAIDSIGIRLLQAKRNEYFGEDRLMKPPPHHVAIADVKYKLGTSDPAEIDLVKLGWQQDILI